MRRLLGHRRSLEKPAAGVDSPTKTSAVSAERKPPFVNPSPRKCKDGVSVGDQVYSTRRYDYDILWTVGTVTKLDSTDLIEVRWNAQAFDPHGEIFPLYSKGHKQWHDRAGMAHTHCRAT